MLYSYYIGKTANDEERLTQILNTNLRKQSEKEDFYGSS